MKFKINGKDRDLEVRSDDTAVDVIRDMLKLTGTKLVCGQGVCGACTVLIDGVPTLSCLHPADNLEGCSVQTIEAFGRENLHPVQKAFMACDGLQCGFCTPGFITEAIAFYEDWRKTNGKERPPKQVVVDAMSGHLCRCGAYPGIFEAVQRACVGEFDGDLQVLPKRIDALEKVTGDAKFTADIYFQSQLIGKVLRSPHAYARVREIDTELIESFPGVLSLIHMLGPDRIVRYVGQPILAYAATDKYSAEQAMNFIKVQYDILEPTLTIDQALEGKAPTVYNTAVARKGAPNAAEGIIPPGVWRGNVRKPQFNLVSKSPGRARRRIRRSRKGKGGVLAEGKWTTQHEIHTPLETHVCVAKWESSQELTVFLSTQACDLMSREIGKAFDLLPENVNVVCRNVGGAFGSKLGLTTETLAAIRLSRASDLPVKVELTRREEMTVGGSRPGTEIDLALRAGKKGNFEALTATAYTNSGVGINSMVASLMRFVYPGAPKHLADYDVVTNFAPSKPFRGPSAPQTCWALEQAIDGIAVQLDKDPLQLRRSWDKHELRSKLLKEAALTPIWKRRPNHGSDQGRFRRGVGMASGNWFNFYHPATKIKVSISAKGLSATTASQDMGNGTRTVIAKIIADVFGIHQNDVIVNVGHSKAVRGPMSAGSRTTSSLYAPTYEAANMVRNKLMDGLRNKLKLINPVIKPDGIQHGKGYMNWRGVFSALPSISYTAKRGKDTSFDPYAMIPIGADDIAFGRGFTGAVYIAEVEVDTLLGKTRVLNVWGGLAAGKIVCPDLARSQCEGAVIQGIGYALYEEKHFDPKTGRILTTGLEDYRLPGIGDVPDMDFYFLERGFGKSKGQLAGIAEIATIPVAASIGNAVFNATGWQPKQLPIRPDRVIENL